MEQFKLAVRLCTSVDSVDGCLKRVIGCFGIKEKTWSKIGFMNQ